MKILFVTNMFPSPDHIYNGIFIKEQIDQLKKDYHIDYELFIIDGRRSKLNYLKSIFLINKLISKTKFDLIHIHFGLSGIFLLFNPFLKTPTLLTVHGSDIGSSKAFGTIKLITKLVVKRANKTILVNDKMLTSFTYESNKLVIIPCGINLGDFDLQRNNTSESFLIGFPADKTRPVKNYKFFKRVINELIQSGHNIEVIEFHNLSRMQVAENLSKLDCLLLTSYREGSPQIIKEAMACQVPIISSNVGDTSLLLSGVDNCYVIDNFLVQEFTQKIFEIIKLDKDKRITSGKTKIEKLNLDQSSVCSKIYKLYTTLIDE